MDRIIQSWKKLWQDLGTRRWIFLFLLGILLVVIAVPIEKLSSHGLSDNRAGYGEGSQMNSGSNGSRNNGTNDNDVCASVNTYEAELESRLTELLSRIEGAGAVQVMVTVSRSSELILQTDTSREENIVRETDSQGGTRDNAQRSEDSQTVLTGVSGSSQPYVVGEIMPQIEGVVVACEGGDRPAIQAEISAAVQALFDLAPHKIKVCKMASP